MLSPLNGNVLFFSFGFPNVLASANGGSLPPGVHKVDYLGAPGGSLPPGVLKVDYLALAMLCISL